MAFASAGRAFHRGRRPCLYTGGILGFNSERQKHSQACALASRYCCRCALTSSRLSDIVAFLRLRRFESMTVHTFLQGFCVADCDWLRPASFSKKRNFHQKQSVQEVEKQKEILADFLFWFVDGFLVNLIKVSSVFASESASSG